MTMSMTGYDSEGYALDCYCRRNIYYGLNNWDADLSGRDWDILGEYLKHRESRAHDLKFWWKYKVHKDRHAPSARVKY